MHQIRERIRALATWTRAALAAAIVLVCVPNVALAGCPAKPSLPSSDGSQPANLGILKLQLIDYKCFGAYDRYVEKALKEATAYVEKRASSAEKLAIVLDIDETSLSNWPNLQADDFGFFAKGECTLAPQEPCGFDAWINSKKAEAIRPTLDLFKAAKAKGVAIFFISARREEQRSVTIENLKSAGYDGWADLILKQPGGTDPVQEFKAKARESVEKLGYTIIANVGDQYSDLAGGHAERTFKVPNPFYFIP